MLMDFLNSLKTLLKVEKVHIDNNVFKLHYKVTVILLVVFSILLSSKQYFGDPIECDVDGGRKDFMDTYCWIYGTFIVQRTLKDEDAALPGLGNEIDRPVVWQMYYQWVSIVLCFQALLFYLPRYLWVTWESGRLRLLIKDLGGPLVSASWNKTTKDKLISYMVCGRYSHDMYCFRYTVCEVLNFCNAIAQIFLMDWLLRGQFSLYGLVSTTLEGFPTMNKVFPKLTKCKFMKYGPSGNFEIHDTICVLPLNVLNEKLFLILWFWIFLLAIVSFFALVYRALIYFVPRVRVYLLMAQARHMGITSAEVIINSLSYGDFFVLYHIGKNISPLMYKELVIGIYDVFSCRVPMNAYIVPAEA